MKNALSDRATTTAWHDACRCERHRMFVAALTLVVCSGFTWPGTLPHLAYVAAHGNVEERLEAVQLLGKYTGDEARDALLSALEDREDAVQLQAAESLGRTGVEAGAARMIEWSSARDPERRAIALRALAGMHTPRALELGTRALSDAEASVRLAAIELLAQRGDDGANALARGLEDHEASVRLAAIAALGARPAPAALPKLSALAGGEDAGVREASLRALGRTREASALPVLLQAVRDPIENVRLAALAALGDSGAPAAVAPLRAALSGEPRAARTAAAALSRLDDARAREALAAQLAQPSTELSEDLSFAAVERARRLAQPAEWSATFAAVSGGLRDAGPARVAPLADALAALAPFTDVQPAKPALLAALRAEHAPALPLARALAALHAPELLPTLLERLPLTAADERGPWLDAIELAWREGLRAEGVLETLKTLSVEGRAEIRQHAVEVLARIAAPLQLLAAGPAEVRALTRQLAGATPAAQPALLRALARALSALPEALEPSLREQLLDRATALVQDSDESISTYALELLRALREPRAAAVIAQQLRLGSVARRAQAVCALADFPNPDTRRLLRYVLQNDGPRVAECATLALAEVGDERDSAALLHAAERGTWPLPAAAAYALARIAQRGVTKKHNFSRGLCHLRAHPDVYVQANLAVGLAALGSEPCSGAEELPQLRAVLTSPGPSALRAATAHLLHVAPDAESERALAGCSADPDRQVARACQPAQTPAADGGRLDVAVRGPDGATPLREQPVALRFDSGLVYVGRSDPNGQVHLPAALGTRVVLEDPAD